MYQRFGGVVAKQYQTQSKAVFAGAGDRIFAGTRRAQ